MGIFEDDSMSHLLEALEITAFDARSMFKLLDRDVSGSVDIQEFCDGCLRLKGEAKSFDVNCLMYENQRLITKTTMFMPRMEELLSDLKDIVEFDVKVHQKRRPQKQKRQHEKPVGISEQDEELVEM